jgi:hypothetical protein
MSLLLSVTRNANQYPQFRSFESAQPNKYWLKATIRIFSQKFMQNSPAYLPQLFSLFIDGWFSCSLAESLSVEMFCFSIDMQAHGLEIWLRC